MSFGHPSWIATHLLGEEGASEALGVTVSETAYGGTSGPWGGISGAAISMFTMTLLDMHNGDVLVFADETFLGWAPADRAQAVREAFPHFNMDRNDVLWTDACPYALPAKA